MKGYYRLATIASALISAVAIYFAASLDWQKQADFDVLGILWLMQNLPRLFAIGMAILMVGLTLYCLKNYLLARDERYGDADEAARLMAHLSKQQSPPKS